MLDEPRFPCIGLVLDTDSCLGPRPVEALDRDPEVNMLDVRGSPIAIRWIHQKTYRVQLFGFTVDALG